MNTANTLHKNRTIKNINKLIDDFRELNTILTYERTNAENFIICVEFIIKNIFNLDIHSYNNKNNFKLMELVKLDTCDIYKRVINKYGYKAEGVHYTGENIREHDKLIYTNIINNILTNLQNVNI